MAATLTPIERNCVARFVDGLCARLADKLEEVWLFGSAARGDMWADFWPMRSDIDLLVVSSESLSRSVEEELCALTYDLYLRSGRQISPAFRTREQLRSKWAPLQREVTRDGLKRWPESLTS